jgi:hypothetical protein
VVPRCISASRVAFVVVRGGGGGGGGGGGWWLVVGGWWLVVGGCCIAFCNLTLVVDAEPFFGHGSCTCRRNFKLRISNEYLIYLKNYYYYTIMHIYNY